MKLFFLISAACITTMGFGQKQPSKPANAPVSVKLTSAADTMQYTIGAYVAKWIIDNGFAITNANLFIKGMDDVFQHKTRLVPDSIIAPLVSVYQQAGQKEKAIKQEQQLFAGLKDKAGIGAFPSGVRYLVLKTGKGPRPAETDSVLLQVIAKLPDGTVVEDTYQSNKPFATTPVSFFSGLNESLQMMNEGSKWQIYVPAALAYAEKGTTLIPPNSALVLEVELLQVKALKK